MASRNEEFGYSSLDFADSVKSEKESPERRNTASASSQSKTPEKYLPSFFLQKKVLDQSFVLHFRMKSAQ